MSLLHFQMIFLVFFHLPPTSRAFVTTQELKDTGKEPKPNQKSIQTIHTTQFLCSVPSSYSCVIQSPHKWPYSLLATMCYLRTLSPTLNSVIPQLFDTDWSPCYFAHDHWCTSGTSCRHTAPLSLLAVWETPHTYTTTLCWRQGRNEQALLNSFIVVPGNKGGWIVPEQSWEGRV